MNERPDRRWKGWRVQRQFTAWCCPALLLISIVIPVHGAPAKVKDEPVASYQIDRDVVDIPFEYRQHQIVVTGEAAGLKGLTFLFDSGASLPVLDASLKVTGPHINAGLVQEAQGFTKAEAIQVDAVRLGEPGGQVSASRVSVLRMDLSQTSRILGRRIDGILGVTFMYGFVLEIDYQRHLLRFHRAKEASLLGRTGDRRRSFMIDLLGTNPFRNACTVLMHGKLDPKYEYDFLLDTGFGGYMSIGHTDAEQAGMLRDDMPRILGQSYSVSRSFRTAKIRAPFLKLGEIDLSNRVVTIDYRDGAEKVPLGIVGNLFLQNFHVTLDFRCHLMLLERVTDQEEPDEANRPSFGLVLRRIGTMVVVERVKHGSPARQAGVRAGDRLLAVQEKRVAGLDLKVVTALVDAAQGETRLRLRHGVDPNLGVGDDEYNVSITPQPPLDWGAD